MSLESTRDGLLEALDGDPASPACACLESPNLGDAVVTGHDQSIMELEATLPCCASAVTNCGSPRTPAAEVKEEDKFVFASGCEGHSCSRSKRPAGSATSDVEENYDEALEQNPEAFGTVILLYVKVKVNGTSTAAFVDSGARTTIMSRSFARHCGIDHLIDTRCSGVARGIGTSTVFGRIHLAFLELDDHRFAASFDVIDLDFDILIGLDMLRKHEASVDLASNCLLMGGAAAPFLPEHKVERHKRRQRKYRLEEGEE